MSDPILFKCPTKKWGVFSNEFYANIDYEGNVYPSAEHLFQALHFDDEDYREEIRKCSTPTKAIILGKQQIGEGWKWRTDLNPIIQKSLDDGVEPIEDFDKDQVMLDILRLKFSQNSLCKETLLSTGFAHLVKHINNDSYWGDGGGWVFGQNSIFSPQREDEEFVYMGGGKNMLGKLLMKVRQELRNT